MGYGVLSTIWQLRSTIIVLLTPALLSLIPVFHGHLDLTPQAGNCLFMLLMMVIYWGTEALPLPVTALLPLVLAPLLGIQTADQVARNYFTEITGLYLGGLIVAVAIEKSHLHQRIAVSALHLIGSDIRLLTLGFMIPTYLISMWINNTAATAMMLPMVQAVVKQLKLCSAKDWHLSDSRDSETKMNGFSDSGEQEGAQCEDLAENEAKAKRQWQSIAKALNLCICYSATIGGLATLAGSVPNLVIAENVQLFSEQLGNYPFGLDFASWVGFALPVSVILIIFCWIWLQLIFIGFRRNSVLNEQKSQIQNVIHEEYRKLGHMTWSEWVTFLHFVLLGVLWLSRNPAGSGGWGNVFQKRYVKDSTSAMVIAISLFMWPSQRPRFCCWRKYSVKHTHSDAEAIQGRPLISWNDVTHGVNWGVMLLISGGFALAEAINVSGLSDVIGQKLNFFTGWPVWAIVMCLSIITAVITEMSSNATVATILLPIVGKLAVKLDLNPLLLMLPVGISSQFSFILPIGNPPNALVFASGELTIKDMGLTGFALSIMGVLTVTVATLTWGTAIFDLDHFNYNTTLAATGNTSFFVSQASRP